MISIYDNLAAAIIASTIFLILIAVNHRTQQAQIETAIFYGSRNMQIDFIETLRRDMAGTTRVAHTEETDSTFSFYSRVGADTTEIQVAYRRTKAGIRGDADLYQIQRYTTRPGAAEQAAGASMSTLTGWKIVGQNEEGNQPYSPDDVRQIHVWFELVPPLSNDVEERRHWETTFRPQHLRTSTNL